MGLKKLIYVNQTQFGYHTVSFSYCNLLSLEYKIIYICFDEKKTKIESNNIEVKYLHKSKYKIIRYINIVVNTIKIYKKEKSPIFLKYFRGCFLIPLLISSKKVNLDIRTGSVHNSFLLSLFFNSILKFESKFFTNITIISESLKNELNIKCSHVLPLGACKNNSNSHNFTNNIKLIYVGTFINRKITEVVRGFGEYIKCFSKHNVFLKLIGKNTPKIRTELIRILKEYDIEDFVEINDEVPYNEVLSILQEANVGIAFIPITRAYNLQPPIKIFEYMSLGLPVIATATEENKKIVNKDNGIIIQDNYIDFRAGIEQVITNLSNYNSETIKKSISNYYYDHIVESNLKPYLSEKFNN